MPPNPCCTVRGSYCLPLNGAGVPRGQRGGHAGGTGNAIGKVMRQGEVGRFEGWMKTRSGLEGSLRADAKLGRRQPRVRRVSASRANKWAVLSQGPSCSLLLLAPPATSAQNVTPPLTSYEIEQNLSYVPINNKLSR